MKYVCELCGSVYDEALGDPKHGIAAGTAFADLPQHYSCSICGCEKEAFAPAAPKITIVSDSGREVGYTKYASDKTESER